MIRVLIVDDEYIMRQGLKYMIHWEQEGYELSGKRPMEMKHCGLQKS